MYWRLPHYLSKCDVIDLNIQRANYTQLTKRKKSDISTITPSVVSQDPKNLHRGQHSPNDSTGAVVRGHILSNIVEAENCRITLDGARGDGLKRLQIFHGWVLRPTMGILPSTEAISVGLILRVTLHRIIQDTAFKRN